ncbi:hypothetical protein GCE9029_00952 [Grimontia celer]|uniref:Polyketide cyclase / dehydrase and lipid transport n=1 Tax=Grimontia celer TaxID=1796497 RepID=A0A128EVL8_9GAMM|nr:hypothetical protein [Grimontia celer]CZF78618.1 hypothetical protein GCE9029_00952 [Grimontia celer]
MNNFLANQTASLLGSLPDESLFKKNTFKMALFANVSHSHTVSVPFPPEQSAFLFTGLGEVLWTPNWHPTFIKGNGFQPNDVFINAASNNTVFVVTQFDVEQGQISYTRLEPQKTVGTIDLIITGDGQGSQVAITYTLTALNKESESEIRALTAKAYATEMKLWESNIASMKQEIKNWLHHALPTITQPK